MKFTHGDRESGVQVAGEGEIVGSGKDGVRVLTDDGREHMVRFEALEGYKKPEKPRTGKGRAPKPKPVAKGGLVGTVLAFFAKAREPVEVSGYTRADGTYVHEHREEREHHERAPAKGNGMAAQFNAAAKKAKNPLRMHPHEDGTFLVTHVNADGSVSRHVLSVVEARRLLDGMLRHKADHHAPHRAVEDRKVNGHHPYGDRRMKKAATVVVWKSDFSPPSAGDGFAPMLVFGAAVAAAQAGGQQAAPIGAADTGPGSASSQPHPEAKPEEAPDAEGDPTEPPERDPRLSYAKRAMLALSNFWRQTA